MFFYCMLVLYCIDIIAMQGDSLQKAILASQEQDALNSVHSTHCTLYTPIHLSQIKKIKKTVAGYVVHLEDGGFADAVMWTFEKNQQKHTELFRSQHEVLINLNCELLKELYRQQEQKKWNTMC